MVEASLSKKVTEQQVSEEDKTTELNFATGWQVEATEEEDGMGDLVDLPIFKIEKKPCMCAGLDKGFLK
jgi:hypothetical protein